MSEEQLMKEIIKEQTQKIINLEQYLRIEKEVSDETIKELEQQVKEKDSVIADLHELKSEKFRMLKKISELEQQNKELRELLDDSEQRRKDLMLSLRNVLDRKKELEHQNKELIATLQIVKDVIEMNPAGAITDTIWISDDPMETETLIDRVEYILNKSTKEERDESN